MYLGRRAVACRPHSVIRKGGMGGGFPRPNRRLRHRREPKRLPRFVKDAALNPLIVCNSAFACYAFSGIYNAAWLNQ